MKKSLLISLATTGIAAGAMAQGSLGGFTGVFDSYGFTVGPGQTTSSATAYFTGNVDIELLYSTSATSGTVAALNALDGTSSGLATAEGDGFVVVSTTSVTGATTGDADGQTFAVSGGELTSADPSEVGLAAPVPTSGTGIIAMFASVVGGADNGYSGLVAWSNQAFGGNPTTHPAGQDAATDTDAPGVNLDMVTTPEPTTLAFAGLGGLSLLLFRRRS